MSLEPAERCSIRGTMSKVQKDHTLEFPSPIPEKKPNIIQRLIKAIKSGFIYAGDKS